MEIADRAIANIISMTMCGDPEVERHACCTAANLMEMPELHSRLLEERGLAPIIALTRSEDVHSREEAARAVANLAANPDMQQPILREGALAPTVRHVGIS